ncbi:apolipoprotein D-like [Tachypleus tridentatus]|uniref:apolipoprotein D-like n=1 Tax=Tachypleus tridentatus TaxID=6853 RepID=UPI003FD62E25
MNPRVVLSAFLVFLMGTVVEGQVPCKNHEVMENFNATRFMGRWYEIRKSFQLLDFGVRCVMVEYRNLRNDTFSLIHKGIGIFHEKKQSKADLAVLNSETPAKLLLKYETLPYYENYYILDTDYDNYAITWSCLEVLPRTRFREILTILARKPKISRDLQNFLNNFVRKRRIRTVLLAEINQDNCPEL